jgi:hypothetical protein
MQLEQHQMPIDGVDQPGTAGQGVEDADAAVGYATVTVADLVVDVAGGEHRLIAGRQPAFVEPAFNPALASSQLSAYLGLHSKSFSCRSV